MEDSQQPNGKPQDEALEPEPETSFERMVALPHIQEAIAQIPGLIAQNTESKLELARLQVESHTTVTRGVTKGILFWTVIITLIIVGPITWLAWTGKISSDAVAFLFGTLVGAAFTFLRNFFPSGT